jgi:hypothetical protein
MSQNKFFLTKLHLIYYWGGTGTALRLAGLAID